MNHDDCYLTICSVSFKSAFYLNLNRQLVTTLNPARAWTWIVVENTPPGADGAVSKGDGFVVLDGDPNIYVGPAGGSYHHGVALNKTLQHIRSRFALFLDPDFYIVRPDWIRDVLSYMQAKGLAFFGAPWHPRWIGKYRYFPCVHCMFVDLERIKIESFDFSPDVPQLLSEPISSLTTCNPTISSAFQSPSAADRVLSLFVSENFKAIGSTRDTGYRVYLRHHLQNQVPSECVAPVFRVEVDYVGPAFAVSQVARLVGRMLPDRFNFIPMKPGYYTRSGFRDHGYPDATGQGWEEFMWKEQPFGFHLRGHARVERQNQERDLLRQMIKTFSKQDDARTY